jgi:ATP sulfurylase
MAKSITPKTMQAARPASALYKKVIRKNTGATKALLQQGFWPTLSK